MLDKHTRTVPVIDGGVFVGVLSRRDVLRCVARRELTSAAAAARGMDRPHSERPASTPPEPGSLNKPATCSWTSTSPQALHVRGAGDQIPGE
jgi:CBS domain-containing protein